MMVNCIGLLEICVFSMTGGVSMTLRHRLLCTIHTEHEVKTTSTELCPVSPSHNLPAKFDLGKLRIPDHDECVPSMLVSGRGLSQCENN